MEYIPIFRYKITENQILLGDLNSTYPISPHLEIVDGEFFNSKITELKMRYPELLIELPIYLTESSNKHTEEVNNLMTQYQHQTLTPQANFYIQNVANISTPVVSCMISDMSYLPLLRIVREIKETFNKIAVRVFVKFTDLTQNQKTNLQQVFSELRNGDIVLLDILQFEGVESQVMNNLDELITLIRNEKRDIKIFLMNAFDVDNASSPFHNFTPLLTKIFGTDGFGDFALIYRFEGGGGGGATTKSIRYYNPLVHTLVHFVDKATYIRARAQMIASNHWNNVNQTGHLIHCNVCTEVNTSQHNEGHTYWKRFKIVHYIRSLISHTIPLFNSSQNPEDFDMDGYDAIYKKEENDSE